MHKISRSQGLRLGGGFKTVSHYHHETVSLHFSSCIILIYQSIKQAIIQSIFTVRRYALHGLSHRNSVCLSVRPSVRPSVTLVRSTWFHLRSWFLHRMVAPSFYFWGYQVHPKIRRGSPWVRALKESGVGTNWRFSTNKSPYLPNGARYDKGYY